MNDDIADFLSQSFCFCHNFITAKEKVREEINL